MKNKIVSWLLVATLAVSLVACGGTKEEDSAEETAQTEEESEEGGIEVDENLLTMEITVPAEFAEGTTQEELDDAVKENGFKSATINEDGSVTYVMTKGAHKKYMAELKDEMSKTLSELVESEEYPNYTDIKVNDDFTSFSITTKSSELSFEESFSVLVFYMYGGIYNAFNGTPVDNVHVDFVNADSGEIISSSDSKDMEE